MEQYYEEVTDEKTLFAWSKNILSTYFLEQQLSEELSVGGLSSWPEEIVMQMAGDETIKDPTFVNKLNTNINTVSIGQFCMQAIRAKQKENCGRSIDDSYEFNCSGVKYKPEDFNEEDASLFTDKTIRHEWQRVTELAAKLKLEISSSQLIDGHHGEYDLSKGHFHCINPYVEESSPRMQFLQFFSSLYRPQVYGFPFGMDSVRAIVYHINLYDVQSQIYNSITVLFERSSARFIQGGKIEVIPYFVPGEDEESTIVTLLFFRVIGLLWTLSLVIITLVSFHTTDVYQALTI